MSELSHITPTADRVLAEYQQGGPGSKHPNLDPLLDATNAALNRGSLDSTGKPSESDVFDSIAHEDAVGEYWLAREMQHPLGYESWQIFQAAINRAVVAINNVGDAAPDHVMATHKLVEIGSGAQRKIIDYRLTRFGAYMVAMNGDPRKPEIAAAQTYFAVKTREAETRPALSEDQIVAQALQITARRVEKLEVRVAELEPKADAYDTFIGAVGHYNVGTVAKMLGTSQNKLYQELRNIGVLISKGAMRNTPYQRYMRHFTVKAHDYERSNGELGTSYTTYVQPTGIDFIRRKLGLGGTLLAVAQ